MDYWSARELKDAFEYSQWRNFLQVIEKAKSTCLIGKFDLENHFADVSKMVKVGTDANREIDDINLSRYASYLIVQNGDPGKEIIALGQTYFAIQTRKQEINDDFEKLDEDSKRLQIRQDVKSHNKLLVEAANEAGVETSLDYGVFQNYGYMVVWWTESKRYSCKKRLETISGYSG